MPEYRYLLALGSNMRHPRHGAPRAVLRAAFGALDACGVELDAASPILASAPLGPSRRRYANAAAVVRTTLSPPEMLAHLKAIEARFGHRPAGMPWRSRMLDLDIILWSEGPYAAPDLVIPHKSFRQRHFVLQPARSIAAAWRDPITNLTIAHLHARLTQARATLRAQPPAPVGQGALSSVGRATDF